MSRFTTYKFRYKFMYMKNIVKLYLKSWVPRFQMLAAAVGRIACAATERGGKEVSGWLAAWQGLMTEGTVANEEVVSDRQDDT